MIILISIAIPVAIHSSKSVTEESGLDESEDFIEKDSGLGDSLSSSPSGEISPIFIS
jgi:hypothetical protein